MNEEKKKDFIKSIIIVSPFILWFSFAVIVSIVALISYVFTGEATWLFGIKDGGRFETLIMSGVFSGMFLVYPFNKLL